MALTLAEEQAAMRDRWNRIRRGLPAEVEKPLPCEICGKVGQKRSQWARKWPRGVFCHRCLAGLKMFRWSRKLLAKAAQYSTKDARADVEITIEEKVMEWL
jgi:hypothetical protein